MGSLGTNCIKIVVWGLMGLYLGVLDMNMFGNHAIRLVLIAFEPLPPWCVSCQMMSVRRRKLSHCIPREHLLRHHTHTNRASKACCIQSRPHSLTNDGQALEVEIYDLCQLDAWICWWKQKQEPTFDDLLGTGIVHLFLCRVRREHSVKHVWFALEWREERITYITC